MTALRITKTHRNNQTFEKLFRETVLMDEKALLLAAAWYLVQCPENAQARLQDWVYCSKALPPGRHRRQVRGEFFFVDGLLLIINKGSNPFFHRFKAMPMAKTLERIIFKQNNR